MSIRAQMEVEGADRALAQLRQLDKKVQRTVVRKATTAAGKEVFNETRRAAQAVKQTGFTARSMKTVTQSRAGKTTVRVGQAKQRTFKARKSNRVKGKNLSQIQRAAKPVPIHWIERGTKAHIVRAAPGKRLVFQVGRRTKFKSGLAFAVQVQLPGMKARHLLRGSARRSQSRAAAAFTSEVRKGVSIDA